MAMYFLCFNDRKAPRLQLGDPFLLRSASKSTRSLPKRWTWRPAQGATGEVPEETTSGAPSWGELSGSASRWPAEASADRYETEPDSSPQVGTPEAAPPSTSPVTPHVGCLVQRFGRLCMDFEKLRKRKGSPSCGSASFAPLKWRKYIAVDK